MNLTIQRVVTVTQKAPHVFELADRIHIHRLGRRIAVIDPKKYTMSDAVAIMTGPWRDLSTDHQRGKHLWISGCVTRLP